MPSYTTSARRHRISLKEFDGSDNWVDIREGRSSRAAARINSAGIELTGLSLDGRPNISTKFDLNEMRVALFEESIVAWSLTGEEAATGALPLDRHTFEQLDSDVAAYLDAEITRYYAGRRFSEQAIKNSNGNSSTPSEPADEFPTPSLMSN